MAPSPPISFAARARVAALLLMPLLTGCGALDKGAEMLGYRKPDIPLEQIPIDRKVPLRLHAGDRLNVDVNGRSLSVVVRIYRLKSATAFLAAPYSAFASAAAEQAALGGDLVEVREIVLAPGQKHEVVEKLPLTLGFIGVVALFRTPAPERWHFVFPAKGSEGGITLGLHACAMNVAAGEPVGASPESRRLAGTRCP